VAATPPGSLNAATKSKAKKAPMLSVPSTAALIHHVPVGRMRVMAASARPAGSARSAPASSGRSAGSISVLMK